MPGLRRHRIAPEEVAAARARLDALSQEWVHTEPVVVGGWTPAAAGPPPPSPEQSDDGVALPTMGALGPLAGRLGLPSAGAAGLVVVAVLAVLVALGWGWYTRARPEVATARPATSGSGAPAGFPSAASSPASPTPAPHVVVDVAGRVRRPGLVTLPAGSRVADALRAAGGVRGHPDLTAVNLAAVLVDGQQIVVGVGGTAAAPSSSTSGAAAPGQPVDLNNADATGLDALPGIGPVLAQRIVDYRTAHGPFHDVGQLQDVTGIGPAKFADLRALVRV